jgi:hypothetical protein
MKHFISAIAVAFLAFCFAPNSHAQQGKPGMGMKMTGKNWCPRIASLQQTTELRRHTGPLSEPQLAAIRA